jgi:Flp pilus assembly protein TadD
VSHYQRALEVSPGDATAHYDLALLLSRLPGRDAEAIGQYRISLGLRPESAEAHNNLGILLARSPESAGGAIQEFMEAVRLDPKYTSAYLNMAILQLHQGRPDEARASCEKALQLDPGNSFAAQILGSLRNTPGR